MRILLDTEFPSSIEYEPLPLPNIELLRYSGGQIDDKDLVKEAANKKAQAIVVLSRESLYQPILRQECHKHAIVLIVIDTHDPFDARNRFMHNLSKLKSELSEGNSFVFLVLKSGVQPIEEESLD